MAREAALVSAILRFLRSQGCLAWKVYGSGYGHAGMPDICALVPVSYQHFSVPVFIEVKMAGKKPGPLQMKRLRDLGKGGAVALWTDNLQVVKDALENIRKERISTCLKI